jgi:GDPmannose 4,6-dehydratase
VTRKITRALGRIYYGLQDKLYLGNLDAKRDWGHARDYVEAMWLMLQQPEPDDYVIATGESHTVREFLELSFAHCGLDWNRHVETDPRYFRPTEVNGLCGDAAKAHAKLGWKPQIGFEEMVRLMVEHDLDLARQEQLLARSGHKVVARGLANA